MVGSFDHIIGDNAKRFIVSILIFYLLGEGILIFFYGSNNPNHGSAEHNGGNQNYDDFLFFIEKFLFYCSH